MTAPNDQAQFLETRTFQVEEICRAFRVLPIMVGYADKTATYASAEQMFLAHIVHTLGPWCRRIETSIAKNLLTDEERRGGLYAKFMLNGLLRGAAKDRAEFYARLYGIGALNPNEIRQLEDLNPYDGGARYRVPLNMIDPATAEDNDDAATRDPEAAHAASDLYLRELKCASGENDADRMRFAGYGAVFGNVDADGDVILPGAFQKSLAQAQAGQASWPVMLLQHGGGRLGSEDLTPINRPVLPNVADCEAGKRSTFTVRVPVEYKEMKQPNP